MPHTQHPPLPRAGIFALIALCAVWGYTWAILKESVRYADPWDYAALRTLPGALLLFGGQPGTTVESAGMLLIGASLTVLSWSALRNRARARSA